ncbi:MAG: phosphomannomutase, partial [Armatimonadetes bacterium]|nr:phosphomannomutase [Armatimonadota bacterium]
MSEKLTCFKVYDVRGKVPSELNADIAYRIGRALADETRAKTCAIGHDIRLSSEEISDALARGLSDAGVDVFDIGLCGTEMIYFSTAHYGYDAGVMITASHNPPEYNGMKIVREESKPISGDSGLWEIERRTRESVFERSGAGSVRQQDVYDDFVNHVLRILTPDTLKPLKVLANAGNGCAGIAVQAMEARLPLEITPMNFEPDGTFPHGVPNPILEESRADTVTRMRSGGFDLGVAWDGDYDRCFFFDEKGAFVEGYYIVGLLAQDALTGNPGEAIVHDPRLVWNTLDICERLGGRPVMCKTGHAFIKEKMRAENAIYGGEMSAHHYFRDHWFCDSGILPFLMVARLISRTGGPLSELVDEMMAKYPCSGEINSVVSDPAAALQRIREAFPSGIEDWTDGLSLEFEQWRFNVRSSNTEPIMRLNVESRGDAELVRQKADEIVEIL